MSTIWGRIAWPPKNNVGARELRTAWLLVTATGLVWSALSFALARANHSPTAPFLLLNREGYYAAQTWFLTPVVWLMWLVLGSVAHAIARHFRREALRSDTLVAVAPALAVPILVLWVLPDWLAYLTLGFDSLAKIVRLCGGLTALGSLVWTTLALANLHRLRLVPALTAAIPALFVQASIGAIFIR